MRQHTFLTLLILGGWASLTAEVGAQATSPPVGSWASYRFSPSLPERQQIIVRETLADGTTRVHLEEGAAQTRPSFVITYAIVGETAEGYWLQVTTHQVLDGPPLSITQVLVSKKTGQSLRSQILGARGLVTTPENELRPQRESQVSGSRQDVTVPAGQYQALRGKVGAVEVWVSDRVPAMGVVQAALPNGTLELVKASTSGAKDFLRGRKR